jgi:hypothetical protein
MNSERRAPILGSSLLSFVARNDVIIAIKMPHPASVSTSTTAFTLERRFMQRHASVARAEKFDDSASIHSRRRRAQGKFA